jgi:hypothetical protein
MKRWLLSLVFMLMASGVSAQTVPLCNAPAPAPIRLTDTTTRIEQNAAFSRSGQCLGLATLVRTSATSTRFRTSWVPCLPAGPWRDGSDYSTMSAAIRAAARPPACPPPPPVPLDTVVSEANSSVAYSPTPAAPLVIPDSAVLFVTVRNAAGIPLPGKSVTVYTNPVNTSNTHPFPAVWVPASQNYRAVIRESLPGQYRAGALVARSNVTNDGLVIAASSLTFELPAPPPPPPPPIDTIPVPPPTPGSVWLETFSGQPTTPTRFMSNRWDIQRYSRDREVWVTPDAMPADHGAMDCAGPPATHTMASYDGMVFLCRDHMMTAVKGEGYAAVVLTPNAQLDWANGPATLSFALSTLRRTRRDWMSFYLTPWAEALMIPTRDDAPGLNSQPRTSLWIRHEDSGNLCAYVLLSFGATKLPCADSRDIEARFAAIGMATSPSRRDTVTITISSTRVRVTWGALPMVDAALPQPLPFTQAVVQLGHYSYNPDKECYISPIAGNGTCTANTWHWDDVRLSNSVPFTIIGSTPRALLNADGAFTLNAPAPANAMLRFHAIGTEPDISFTNGATWIVPTRLPVSKTNDPDMQYATPIPAGTTRILFRRARRLVSHWNLSEMNVHDVHVWARP